MVFFDELKADRCPPALSAARKMRTRTETKRVKMWVLRIRDTYEAWQVTIGRYQPFAVPQGALRAADQLTLNPNRYYYRGPSKEPKVIEAKEALEARS